MTNASNRACRVDIVTKPLAIMHSEATGLRTSIQAARVVVTCGDDSRSHVVVRPVQEPWTLPSDDEVRRLFPADFVTCVRADSDGATTLSCSLVDAYMMFGAAAAAATLKRSWGWDESAAILVKFASTEITFKLDPRHENGVWTIVRLDAGSEAEGA